MFFIWLLVVILLSLVEVITVNLTTIWFVASGIVTIFVSMVTDNFVLQFGTFTVLGIILSKDTQVEIVQIDGVKLNVRKVDD